MNANNKIHTLINTLGKGEGFRATKPWFNQSLAGKNLLERLVDYARVVGSENIIVIVPQEKKEIVKLWNVDKITFVCQADTHEVARSLLPLCDRIGSEDLILFINTVNPLLRNETIRKYAVRPLLAADEIYLMSGRLSEPKGMRRIIRNQYGEIIDLKPEVECSEEEKKIKEVDLGYYLMSKILFYDLLKGIVDEYLKKDFSMSDLLRLALYRKKKFIVAMQVNDEEVCVIDNERDLAEGMRMKWRQKVNDLLDRGVIVMDAGRCYVDEEVNVGVDVILYPNVMIEGATEIGSGSIIYNNVHIKDSKIGKGVEIYDNSVIEGAIIEEGVKIGPFARIRPETYVKMGARIGNFVELKKTSMGRNSKANHLSYLGDAIIGDEVNIGAGTITCNYDGVKKHQTVIEDGVFVGSDTQFVAPVRVKKGAYIAAGSTITKDVPEGALGIARGRQENKLGWVKRKKGQKKDRE